jgi:hypothetical protein
LWTCFHCALAAASVYANIRHKLAKKLLAEDLAWLDHDLAWIASTRDETLNPRERGATTAQVLRVHYRCPDPRSAPPRKTSRHRRGWLRRPQREP